MGRGAGNKQTAGRVLSRRSRDARVTSGPDGAITVSFAGLKIRGRGRYETPTNDETDLSLDEEGQIKRQPRAVLVHLEEGSMLSAEGAVDLEPGIYAVTGTEFQRLGNLAGVDDRTRPTEASADRDPAAAATAAQVQWAELGADKQDVLSALHNAISGDALCAVGVGDIAFKMGGFQTTVEQEQDHRQLAEALLPELAEQGLATLDHGSSSSWLLTVAGMKTIDSSFEPTPVPAYDSLPGDEQEAIAALGIAWGRTDNENWPSFDDMLHASSGSNTETPDQRERAEMQLRRGLRELVARGLVRADVFREDHWSLTDAGLKTWSS